MCSTVTAPCEVDERNLCPRACDVCTDPPFGEGNEESETSQSGFSQTHKIGDGVIIAIFVFHIFAGSFFICNI